MVQEAPTTPGGHLATMKPENHMPETCLLHSTVLCLIGEYAGLESKAGDMYFRCVFCEDKTYCHHHGIKPKKETDAVKAWGAKLSLRTL